MINSETDILSRAVSELSQLIVQILDTLSFQPPFGLTGKRVAIVDFLLVLTELFFRYRSYGWGATSENRSKIGDFAQRGHFDPKFQVEARCNPPPVIF